MYNEAAFYISLRNKKKDYLIQRGKKWSIIVIRNENFSTRQLERIP